MNRIPAPRRHGRPPSRRLHGRSLIELLTALVIGFVILAAVLVATSGSNFNGRGSNAQSRLDEDAQVAMSILLPQLKMAGFSQRQTLAVNGMADRRFGGPGVRGCDSGFANANAAGWNPNVVYSTALTCGQGGTPSIAVLYEADIFNTSASAAGLPTDCLGQSLNAVTSSLAKVFTDPNLARVTVAENRYYLGSPANGTWSLMCNGSGSGNGAGTPFNGSTGQSLVSNIENMVLLYGVSSVSATPFADTQLTQYGNSAERYMTASQIDATLAPRISSDDVWSRVVSVKVCLTVRTETEIAETATPYVNCNGVQVTPTDRFLRRTMTSVVSLRNRL